MRPNIVAQGRAVDMSSQRPILEKRLPLKILVDGGDPQETARIRQMLGFVDGQTTNPSLIVKNPEVMAR